MRTLEGKRALVTGGASGIGPAIALAFAAEGAQVAVVDRAPPDKIEAVVADIAGQGGRTFAVQADVADEAQVTRMIETVLARFGGLDVLVNNAGILIEKPLLETTAEEFDRLIGVNLRGAFLVGREALRVMVRQGGGRVIAAAAHLILEEVDRRADDERIRVHGRGRGRDLRPFGQGSASAAPQTGTQGGEHVMIVCALEPPTISRMMPPTNS